MNILTTDTHYRITPVLRDFASSSGAQFSLGMILQGKKAQLITGSSASCVTAITKAARQYKDVILLKGQIKGEDFYLQEADLHVQASKAASLTGLKKELIQARLKQLLEQALTLSAQAIIHPELKALGISLEKKGESAHLHIHNQSVPLSVNACLKLAHCLETMQSFTGQVSFEPKTMQLQAGHERISLSYAQVGLLARALHAQLLYPEYLKVKAEAPSTSTDLPPSYLEQDHDEESIFY